MTIIKTTNNKYQFPGELISTAISFERDSEITRYTLDSGVVIDVYYELGSGESSAKILDIAKSLN